MLILTDSSLQPKRFCIFSINIVKTYLCLINTVVMAQPIIKKVKNSKPKDKLKYGINN